MSRPTSFAERYKRHIEAFSSVEIPEGWKQGRTPFRQWKITKSIVLWSRITVEGLSSRPTQLRADMALLYDDKVTHLDLSQDFATYEDLEQAWFDVSARTIVEAARLKGVIVTEELDLDRTPRPKRRRLVVEGDVGNWRKFTREDPPRPNKKLEEFDDAQRFYFDLWSTTELAVRRRTWKGDPDITSYERERIDEFFRANPRMTWTEDVLRLRDVIHGLFPSNHPARSVVWRMLKERRALYVESLERDLAYGKNGYPEKA